MQSVAVSIAPKFMEPLSLYHGWQQDLAQAVPLLADISGLSIAQTQRAIPSLLKVIVYRLTATAEQHIITERGDDLGLGRFISQANYLQNHGVNFESLTYLGTHHARLFYSLFEDKQQVTLLTGMLMVMTQLPQTALMRLWKTVTSLVLLDLAIFDTSLSAGVDKKNRRVWLAMQPLFVVSITDAILMQAVGYRPCISIKALCQQQQMLRTKQRSQIPVWQQHIAKKRRAHSHQALFAVVPCRPNNPNNLLGMVGSHHPKQHSNSALNGHHPIFSPANIRTQSPLITKLQQHWIATATVLSMAVFGIMGVAMTTNNASHSTPNATKPNALNNSTYQDVAIIKVASTPAAAAPIKTDNTTATHSQTNDNQTKNINPVPKKPSEKSPSIHTGTTKPTQKEPQPTEPKKSVSAQPKTERKDKDSKAKNPTKQINPQKPATTNNRDDKTNPSKHSPVSSGDKNNKDPKATKKTEVAKTPKPHKDAAQSPKEKTKTAPKDTAKSTKAVPKHSKSPADNQKSNP